MFHFTCSALPTYTMSCHAHAHMQGGDTIWGNSTFAPDDPSEDSNVLDANDVRGRRSGHTHGELISFRRIPVSVPIPEEGETETRSTRLMNEDNGFGVKNMTSEMAGDWILEHTPSSFQVSLTLFDANRG